MNDQEAIAKYLFASCSKIRPDLPFHIKTVEIANNVEIYYIVCKAIDIISVFPNNRVDILERNGFYVWKKIDLIVDFEVDCEINKMLNQISP